MLSNKDYKNFKNLKILITGTTGFKGSWLSFWLSELGAKVTGVSLKPENDSILYNKLKLSKKINQYFFDICNYNKLNHLVKINKPDIIFHLAAQSIVSISEKEPLRTFNTNIMGSANILETFRKNNLPCLVYITSDKCYLNLNKNRSFKESDFLGGLDNYSSSKASAENIFFSYHHSYFKNNNYLKAVSARAGNVIGGGDFKINRIVPDIIKSIKLKKEIFIRNPHATRPWQHVLEPLSGYMLLANRILNKKLNKKIQPNWNFGPERKNCKEVITLTKKILKMMKINKKIKFLNRKEFYESKFLSLNINKSKKELDWRPKLNFNQTIGFTSEWYKEMLLNSNLEEVTRKQISLFSEIDK